MGECVGHKEKVGVSENTFVENPKRRALLSDLDINWMIIFKWIFERLGFKAVERIKWFMTGSSGRFLEHLN
jgi:hypothetical protein